MRRTNVSPTAATRVGPTLIVTATSARALPGRLKLTLVPLYTCVKVEGVKEEKSVKVMAEETSVMQVIPKLVDFIEWIIPALDKFPKSRKFLLADRIETGLLDVLGKLIEANYSREKLVLLRKANLQLEKIRYLLRIAYRLRCFDVRCQDATRPGHGSFMKTHRRLFDRVTAFPNLLLASKLA